jgi:hypothetical protein
MLFRRTQHVLLSMSNSLYSFKNSETCLRWFDGTTSTRNGELPRFVFANDLPRGPSLELDVRLDARPSRGRNCPTWRTMRFHVCRLEWTTPSKYSKRCLVKILSYPRRNGVIVKEQQHGPESSAESGRIWTR